MNPAPNLIFIGPMGAGKTTVGRRVAELLGMPFLDLDHEIEAHTGAAISLVFDLEGEAGFRKRESATLAELAAGSGIVLSTGGGAVLSEANRRVLRARGFVDLARRDDRGAACAPRARPPASAAECAGSTRSASSTSPASAIRSTRRSPTSASSRPAPATAATPRGRSSTMLETRWQRGNTGAAA